MIAAKKLRRAKSRRIRQTLTPGRAYRYATVPARFPGPWCIAHTSYLFFAGEDGLTIFFATEAEALTAFATRVDPRASEAEMSNQYTAQDLVLCESADGWSLHPPGSTDEDIASGDAPYLLDGDGHPTDEDYRRAFALWREG